MSNILPVKEIRRLIEDGKNPVEPRPGVYKWWFRASAAKEILKPLDTFKDWDSLAVRKIDGETYYALYFGIGGGKQGLKGRIRWHVCQKHSASSVRSGFLSTLRQTISALKGCDMSKSESVVNDFMDENCYWEWKYTDTIEDAETIEKKELSTNCYPLNVKDNRKTDEATVRQLSVLRCKYKK